MVAGKYIKLTESEKSTLESAVEQRFGDTGRISYGAAIRIFAESATSGDSSD